VTLGGKVLPAGTYGLHTIPTDKDWTIILSADYSNWGSFSYDEKEDVLRFSATPRPADFQERLDYRFENLSDNGATAVLHWEKLEVPFPIEVDTKAVTFESIKRELHGLQQFFWQPWNQAANWCVRNDYQLDQALAWAEELGLVVVSVDYRLAPEFPYPAAIDDCYAGLVWLVESATALGIDQRRIILAGDSGGGGLAASLAILARDRGGPSAIGQVLMAPMLDDRNDTVASHQMAGLGIWDRTSNETGWRALLGDAQGGPDVSPYAAAARADDLTDLPATFLDVGSAETFRDEVVTFASRIWAAGGDAELHVWPGGFHGYYLDLPEAQLSVATLRARVDWLKRLLSRQRTTDAEAPEQAV
jgi:acetyl esterase/lipase